MKYLALYRKYRPVTFDDLVGQKQIVTVLKNAILNDKLSHAYLFSGPRGTGKTTMAKIISRMVNCLDLKDGVSCGKCINCLNTNNNDVIEIDAASNNGVDEIRELKEKINLVPNSGKYKIYIIDEVHMLTIQAFNALLKTLEEPPSHVIFILATTEINKIPLTISSRCQKFTFTKINDNDIANRLIYIAGQENIKISNDAAFEIARLSDGGLRDAINLLDELSVYGNGIIELSDVDNFSGAVSYSLLFEFISNIKNCDYGNIVVFIDKLEEDGKSLIKFLYQLIDVLKNTLIFKNCGVLGNIEVENEIIKLIANDFDNELIYKIINEFNELKNKLNNSDFVKIIFVVSIFKICSYFNSSDIKKFETLTDSCELDDVDTKLNDEKLSIKIKKNTLKNIDLKINNCFAGASKKLLLEYSEKWKSLSDYLSLEKFSVIAGLLNDVRPVLVSDDYVILCSKFESVCDRLYENFSSLNDFIFYVYEKKYDIIVLAESKWDALKDDYVKKIKSGYKYKIIALENDNNKSDALFDRLVDLVGNDKIEFK